MPVGPLDEGEAMESDVEDAAVEEEGIPLHRLSP